MSLDNGFTRSAPSLFINQTVSPIARFIGPTCGTSGADRTQVGPMLAPWTLLSGDVSLTTSQGKASVKRISKLANFLCAYIGRWTVVRLWIVGCSAPSQYLNYHKTSNINRTLVSNKIVDNSDVVGASPLGAAPTTSSFSTKHMASMDWAKTTARGYKKHLSLGIWCYLY